MAVLLSASPVSSPFLLLPLLCLLAELRLILLMGRPCRAAATALLAVVVVLAIDVCMLLALLAMAIASVAMHVLVLLLLLLGDASCYA
jgi:hypothetical protein